MAIIYNSADKPLFEKSGTTPDVSGAMQDYFQPLQFTKVVKNTVGFQVLETLTPVNFRGVLQPFTDRQLVLKPEGQRAWTWFMVHADYALLLDVDEIININLNNKPTRVMQRKDFNLYGYVEYHLVQDWEIMR